MARTQELFSIGDVAQLFHLSVSSLRHYETIGLLTPEYTDPATGYRYYGPRQFEVLNTIRYLRALDMPLGQIRAFLRSPACRIVWMSGALELHSFLDMEPSIRMLERSQAEAVVFLGKVGVGLSAERLLAGAFAPYDRAFLVLDDEDAFDGDVTTLPETTCAAVCFRGSHPEAPAQYARLMDYLRAHALAPADFSREITMIDYGLTSDPEKFVTEIRIPVTET